MCTSLTSLVIAFMFYAEVGYFARANQDNFLSQRPEAQNVDITVALLQDMFGADVLQDLKTMMQPTFASLPKNKEGNLGSAGVRYTLHRLFVKRHGWRIKFLDPAGGSWNQSSPLLFLQGKAPQNLQQFLQHQLDVHGLNLDQMSMLAAAFENIVHEENLLRLRGAYWVHGVPVSAPLGLGPAQAIMDTYMAAYIMGRNISTMTATELANLHTDVAQVYPTWPQTLKFVRQQRDKMLPGGNRQWLFADVQRVMTEVSSQYGRWQTQECNNLKSELLLIEGPSSSCIPISNFYGGAVNHGKWQFSESLDYLRQLGALEESDATHPKIILPNYMNSMSNCLAASSFYSVCCINECEDLFGKLEDKLMAQDADPESLAILVSTLPSSSVPAGRVLPGNLLSHLRDIAEHHNGRVPLHGRLFQQWMHHAYPHECPYPHTSWSTKQVSADVWESVQGQFSTATEEEMRKYISPPLVEQQPAPEQQDLGQQKETCVPWTAAEELVVNWKPSEVDYRAAWTLAVSASALTAFATMMLGVIWKLHKLTGGKRKRGQSVLMQL